MIVFSVIVACSVILVGKDASSTGRVLVGHNEDDGGEKFVLHGIVPAREHAEGTVLPSEKGLASVPQVPNTQKFFWTEVKDHTGGLSNADTFLNESGVLVVSDNAAPMPWTGEDAELTDGGIYYNLRRAIGERATSAREAVAIATNLLSRYGYAAEGRIYSVADKDEAWSIQVLKGKRFVARRCPDDGVVAVPNCLTIRRLESGDVVSPCVAKRAAKNPSFDFAKTYQGAKRWRQPNDTKRWRSLYRIAAGVEVGDQFPFSVKPSHKVTQADLKAALSSHHEGTTDAMPHHKHGIDRPEAYLPVCRWSTIESLVCAFGVRPDETELELAPGSPCENAYRKFRPFADGLPSEFDRSYDALERLEKHCQPMTFEDYLFEQAQPSPRDGIVRCALKGVPGYVLYDAAVSLDDGSSADVAVIYVQGWGGGLLRADSLLSLTRELKAARPENPPYMMAALFPRADMVRDWGFKNTGLACWNASWDVKNLATRGSADDDWRGGGDAVGTKLSSYDVIDKVFEHLSDPKRFPNLKRIVLTGFSAGGQFVGRYAAVGKGKVRKGIEVAYVAMAPSTELRLDPDVRWHYGLKDRPRYSADLTDEAILANLSSRRVWRACGAADTLTYPQTSLDSCPEAMRQGPNRLERFRNFQKYLKAFPAWEKQVTFKVLPHLGHNNRLAHMDPDLISFLLNGDTPKEGGCPCRCKGVK